MTSRLWLGGHRYVKFIFVGVSCGLLQIAVLFYLNHLGWDAKLANIIGFVLSAQVNFLLSYYLTWRDRKDHRLTVRRLFLRVAFFNLGSLVVLAINATTFSLAVRYLHYLPSALLGIGLGTICKFLWDKHLSFQIFSRPILDADST